MYRYLLFFSFFLYLLLGSLAQAQIITTRTPYHSFNNNGIQSSNFSSNYVPQYNSYGMRSVDIDSLEKYVFNRNFYNENSNKRLERLEQYAFGNIQRGNFFDRYDNVKTFILSRPKDNYKQSLARKLGNFFIGQMTGSTPQLYDGNEYSIRENSYSNSFPSDFGNRYVSEGSGPYGRYYMNRNYNTGNTSSVRILD